MVICLIALPVFIILGLFSLRYRILAAEAFRCLFRTIQLKPCDTGLDQRVKSKFTTKLMWWPALARGFYRHFALLSWIFVILTVASTIATGYGLYNYVLYGNCNGEDSSAFCIFNPVHSQQSSCSVFGVNGSIDVSKVGFEGYPSRGDGGLIIHEFGCFSCPFTKDAEPVVREVLDKYPDVKLIYHDVPMEIHNYSVEAGIAAICAEEQGKFWEYHDLLFEKQDELNDESFVEFAAMLDLNIAKFSACLASNSTLDEIDRYRREALEIGIYGTPTFVIGGEVLVGPQSYKTFKDLIEKSQKG